MLYLRVCGSKYPNICAGIGKLVRMFLVLGRGVMDPHICAYMWGSVHIGGSLSEISTYVRILGYMYGSADLAPAGSNSSTYVLILGSLHIRAGPPPQNFVDAISLTRYRNSAVSFRHFR